MLKNEKGNARFLASERWFWAGSNFSEEQLHAALFNNGKGIVPQIGTIKHNKVHVSLNITLELPRSQLHFSLS